MNYYIGNLKLKNRIFLAPMAEVNDIAFRTLCKKAGAGLVYTGMLNALSKQKLDLDDKPGLQLFGVSEEGVKEFIKKYGGRVSLFDFNLGCPAKLARKLGHGVFLHYKLDVIERILKMMRASTDKPITIKLRKSKHVNKIIKIAEKYCDAICIHPRTSDQGYSGEADVEYALKIKQKTSLPVIYSGNVNEENVGGLLEKFDFVMVGREALGDPEIFARMLGKKVKGVDFKDYLKLADKYKLYFRQIKLQAMHFTRKKEGAKEMRLKLIGAKTIGQVKRVFENHL